MSLCCEFLTMVIVFFLKSNYSINHIFFFYSERFKCCNIEFRTSCCINNISLRLLALLQS